MELRLDKNEYNEQELITFSIPLNLPYQTNWKDFERFDGEVEIEGVTYKYVKRKVLDGKLLVLCIPNNIKMNLQTSRDDFFKLVNDLQQPGNGKKSETNQKGFKNFSTEYWQSNSDWKCIAACPGLINTFLPRDIPLYPGYITICEQPPDA